MKIGYFTDVHISDNPPRMRKEGYKKDIFSKLEFIQEYCKDYDLMICGGDIFHDKKSEKISFGLINQLLELFREFPPTVIVAGNHDLSGMSVSERPINIFNFLPNITMMVSGSKRFFGCNVVGIGGGDLFSEEEIIEKLKEEGKRELINLAVIHAPVTAKPMSFPFQTIGLQGMISLADIFLLGHLHSYQFCNKKLLAPGAISRGVLNLDESLERKVCFGEIEISNNEIGSSKLIEIPVKSVDDVFKVEQKMGEIKSFSDEESFSKEIESLGLPKGLNKEDLIEQIRNMDRVDEFVKKKAIIILEGQ